MDGDHDDHHVDHDNDHDKDRDCHHNFVFSGLRPRPGTVPARGTPSRFLRLKMFKILKLFDIFPALKSYFPADFQ